ncbi:MAG: hypothetical protein ACRDO1_12775 [Nocardioidaceae bacterium]
MVLRLVSVVVLPGLSAACGSSGDGPPEPSEDSETPMSTVPPPSRTPGKPPTPPTDQTTPLTVRGTVERPGDCVELVGDVSRFVLVGEGVDELSAGAEVEVLGLPNPGQVTTCNGIVLRVRELHPR